MMKIAGDLLKKLGWYEYFRYSFLFNVYTRLFKRQVIRDHQKEVQFYRSFLPAHSPLIFDIGAYDGSFWKIKPCLIMLAPKHCMFIG